jgi:hypothetical protein
MGGKMQREAEFFEGDIKRSVVAFGEAGEIK